MSSPRHPLPTQQQVTSGPEPGEPPAQGPAKKSRPGRAHCSSCQAGCCRLVAILQPDDHVPEDLTTYTLEGLHVMKRGEDGWCVALDRAQMNCGIYETRPSVCRRFAMNGPYCKVIHAQWSVPAA